MSDVADDDLLNGEEEFDYEDYDLDFEKEEALLQDDYTETEIENKKDTSTEVDQDEDVVLNLDIEEEFVDLASEKTFDEDEESIKTKYNKFSIEKRDNTQVTSISSSSHIVKQSESIPKKLPPESSIIRVDKVNLQRNRIPPRRRFQNRTNTHFNRNNQQRERKNGLVLINRSFKGVVHADNNTRLAFPQSNSNNHTIQPWANPNCSQYNMNGPNFQQPPPSVFHFQQQHTAPLFYEPPPQNHFNNPPPSYMPQWTHPGNILNQNEVARRQMFTSPPPSQYPNQQITNQHFNCPPNRLQEPIDYYQNYYTPSNQQQNYGQNVSNFNDNRNRSLQSNPYSNSYQNNNKLINFKNNSSRTWIANNSTNKSNYNNRNVVSKSILRNTSNSKANPQNLRVIGVGGPPICKQEESPEKKSKLEEVKQIEPPKILKSITIEPEKVEEEDEETRLYRLKIEEQKKKREEILRQKEERRKLQMQQKQQEIEEKKTIEIPPPKPQNVLLRKTNANPNIVVVNNKKPSLQTKISSLSSSSIIDDDNFNLTFKVENDLMRNPHKNNNNPPQSNFMANRVVLVKNKQTTSDLSSTESFFNNRKVLKKDNSLLNTRVVLIKNLSASTTQNKLVAMTHGIGEIQKLRMDKQERQATILFKTVASAHAFFKKYQRYMLDLSMIEVQLESML